MTLLDLKLHYITLIFFLNSGDICISIIFLLDLVTLVKDEIFASVCGASTLCQGSECT